MDFGTILGIFLGGVSLVMAIPPFTQMLFGRPALKFGVDDFTGSDGEKAFSFKIKNEPITSSFLRKIGVIREVGEVMAYFNINEIGSNKLIKADASGMMHCAASRNEGLLVRCLPAFTVGFTVIQFKNGNAFIIDARVEKIDKILPVGDYTITATIICGERPYKIIKNLRVGQTASQSFWL